MKLGIRKSIPYTKINLGKIAERKEFLDSDKVKSFLKSDMLLHYKGRGEEFDFKVVDMFYGVDYSRTEFEEVMIIEVIDKPEYKIQSKVYHRIIEIKEVKDAVLINKE